MEESVLMLASFEKTTDHLFDAAVHSRQVRGTWFEAAGVCGEDAATS